MTSFVIFAMSLIFTSVDAVCKPGEYMNHGICCPMCNSGSVVKFHCTASSPSSVCLPCTDGTYMDHPNGLTKCLKCTDCDTGAGLMEVKKCTYTSDAECECKPGYYCSSKDSQCDLCLQHTICKPGEYVKVQGTSKNDNVCEPCPDGTFSISKMSQNCTKWTNCREQNCVKTKEGTSTSDVVCVDRRNRVLLIVPVLSIAICGSLLYWTICKDKSANASQEDPGCYVKPVQETRQQDI